MGRKKKKTKAKKNYKPREKLPAKRRVLDQVALVSQLIRLVLDTLQVIRILLRQDD